MLEDVIDSRIWNLKKIIITNQSWKVYYCKECPKSCWIKNKFKNETIFDINVRKYIHILKKTHYEIIVHSIVFMIS